MNKSIFGFAASLVVALASASASAGYLYCMIENAENVYNGEAIVFDYATISIDGGSSYLHFYNTTGQDTGFKMGSEASSDKSGYYSSSSAEFGLPYYASIAPESDYTSFLFQLWDDDSVVGWQRYSKGALADSIFDNTSMTGDKAFVVTQVIPEPTSGLLLLFGLAGLALRRKIA